MTLPFLIAKEVKIFLRNVPLVIVVLILPMLLVNTLPRVASQDVRDGHIAVVDHDHSLESQRLTQRLDASEYLCLNRVCSSHAEALDAVTSGEADAIVEFPCGYGKAHTLGLSHNPEWQMMVSADATNGMKGAMATSYVAQICSAIESPTSVRYIFNPTLEYKRYMVPAVVALMLTLIISFLPALNIVGENEKGTIEQIKVTPISKASFIASKTIPYMAIALIMTTEALIAGKVFHGIAPAGGVSTVLAIALLFSIVAASLGLIISNFSQSIPQAALTIWFFIVIFLLTSGMITPTASMPAWAQAATMANPMRHMVEAMRDVYIKGGTLTDLTSQVGSLAIFAIVGWTVAVRSFKKN